MAGRDARLNGGASSNEARGAGGASAASFRGDGAEARDRSSSRPGVAADRSTDDAGVRGTDLRSKMSADRASRAHRAAATSALATSAFNTSMRPFVFSNSLRFVARRRSMRSSNALLFAALRSALCV